MSLLHHTCSAIVSLMMCVSSVVSLQVCLLPQNQQLTLTVWHRVHLVLSAF